MKKNISLILIFAIIVSLPVNAFAKGTFNEDANAIATAAESVVMLTCYDNNDEIISTASGFLAIEDGLIITNFHVINHEIRRIVANTEDGMYFDVDEIVCYDSSSDIAILKTKAKTRLDLLKLGDSDALGKGSRVVAIGSPLGLLNTVSEGIYSGIIFDEEDYILFTAAISSGSSGGALFNNDGEVIGITSASYTEGQNLNLAVPINSVKKLWNDYTSGNYIEQVAEVFAQEEENAEVFASPNSVDVLPGSYVIACRKGSGLTDAINHILYDAYANGALNDYAAKYNLVPYLEEIPSNNEVSIDANDEIKNIRERGTLNIGVFAESPHSVFAVKPHSTWEGFNIDLAQYIADYLGVDLKKVTVPKANGIRSLNEKNIDLMFGFSTEDDYSEETDYSVSYCKHYIAPEDRDTIYSSIEEFYEAVGNCNSFSTAKEIVEKYLKDSEYYKEALDYTKTTFYKKATLAYKSKNTALAAILFKELGNYKDSQKFYILANAVQEMGASTEYYPQNADIPFADNHNQKVDNLYDSVMVHFDFANAKAVIINKFPIHFLAGNWYGKSGEVFIINLDKYTGRTSSYTTLPNLSLSNSYFFFEDGYYRISNNIETKDVYRISILNKQSISVYCYQDGSTHVLYRQ